MPYLGSTPPPHPRMPVKNPGLLLFFVGNPTFICNSQLGGGWIPSTNPGKTPWWIWFFWPDRQCPLMEGFFLARSFYICDVRMFFWCHLRFAKKSLSGVSNILKMEMLDESYMKARKNTCWVNVWKKNMCIPAYMVIRALCKGSIILHFECIFSLHFPEKFEVQGQEWFVGGFFLGIFVADSGFSCCFWKNPFGSVHSIHLI